jgi:hypothetical protein
MSASVRIAPVLLGLLALIPSAARAERPAAPTLLPETTLAMIRITDVPEMRKRFGGSIGGKLIADPEIAPMVSKLYASLGEWWTDIEDRVGLPLDQLLTIPQGEICVAVVGQAEGPPAIVALVDVKDRLISAQRLIEKGEAALTEQGGSKTTEVIDDVRCHVYSGPNGRRQLVHFEKDGTLAFVSTQEAAKQVLSAWKGNDEKKLADKDAFAAIMSRCKGAKDDPPQLTWFVDPIQAARAAARGNAAAQTGLALIPVLGLDGLLGAGGSMLFDAGEFDVVGHAHLLLSNPRSGVLELLTLGSGDTSPEPWVPADAASYLTLHWNLNDMFRRGAKLYNSLTNEGAFEAEVKERVKEAVDLDFETELLPALAGRVTMFTWVQKPYKLNSQPVVVGVRLTDAKSFQPLLDKLLAKIPEGTDKALFGGVTYHRVRVPMRDRPENAPPAELIREPNPCIGIVGDYVLFSDSEDAFRHAIAAQSDKEKQLASQLDFKLIAGKIRRQQGGEQPGMISFNRPEEGMRMLYEVARSEEAKNQLNKAADGGNRAFQILKGAMDDHPLPPFGVLEKYLAPGGSVLTNEETGMHWMTFQLKREN